MWNRINGYHPDEETLEVDWPCHPPRSFHCKNCYALDARRETQAGSPQDHMATDSWEGNKGDGEDLGGHQVHGKGSPDVEGTRCCPTCLLGVKGMMMMIPQQTTRRRNYLFIRSCRRWKVISIGSQTSRKTGLSVSKFPPGEKEEIPGVFFAVGEE